MQPKDKREYTLKELMIMQGKVKPESRSGAAGAAKTAAAPKTPPKKRTEKPSAASKPNGPETREDRLKALVEENPEQAAELLRKVFLKGRGD